MQRLDHGPLLAAKPVGQVKLGHEAVSKSNGYLMIAGDAGASDFAGVEVKECGGHGVNLFQRVDFERGFVPHAEVPICGKFFGMLSRPGLN